MLKVQIFDLDGTISDDAWRKHHLPDYEVYHSMLIDDKIMNLRQLQAAYVSGCDIVIMTARPARFLEDTIAWLDKYNIEYHMLMMRNNDDKRTSVEVKFSMLKDLDHTEIVAAFDDRLDICRMYASQGIASFILDENGASKRVEYVKDPHPADVLEKVAATLRERSSTYKNTYEIHGDVMIALFPEGVRLDSAADFEIFGLMNAIVGKVCRFAATDMTHIDSVHDIAGYAAIAEFVLRRGEV